MKKWFSKGKDNKIYIATIVCFVLLMYVSKMSANTSQYVWLITNNLVGVAVTVLMLSVYPVRDFLKPFYIVWTILGLAGTIGGYYFWLAHQADILVYICVTVPLNIWFLGAVVFKYVEEIFIKKSFRVSISKREIIFIVCMLLMLISSSDTVWPFYYLIVFLLLWHSPFSREQRKNVLLGILDGIVVGFVILQCYAFIYVPYLNSRYIGIYNNCNRNSCLYLIVLASVLSKRHLYRLSAESTENGKCKSKNKRIFLYDCFIAILLAFEIYTGSRTGIAGAALMILLYYFFGEIVVFKTKIKKLILQSILYMILAVISIPVLYIPIRYLPEVRPFVRVVAKNIIRGTDDPFHPIGGVGLYEALSSNIFRYIEKTVPSEDKDDSVAVNLSEIETEEHFIDDIEHDESGKNYVLKYEYVYYPERGSYTTKVPKWLYAGLKGLDYRINISAALFDRMNLFGHKDDEIILYIRSDVPVAPEVYSNNEQNFMIHYLYVYGIPIGILVLSLMLSEVIFIIRKSKKGDSNGIIFLLLISPYFIYGMTEIVWVPGQMEQLLLFFAPVFFDDFDFC